MEDIDFIDILKAINRALNELYIYDEELFNYKTNDKLVAERCLTYRLGYYLQNIFTSYKVDSEYNRYFDEKKELNGKEIYPDLIIHKRKELNNNLLWIEVKKELNKSKEDIERLKQVTSYDKYYYTYGLMLILNVNSYICEWFKKGREIYMINFKKEKVNTEIIFRNDFENNSVIDKFIIRGEEENRNKGITIEKEKLSQFLAFLKIETNNYNDLLKFFEDFTLNEVKNYLKENSIAYDEVDFL